MKEYNEKKAKILYDFLDESEMFKGTVVKEDRSLMNVPFVTGDKELDAKFVAEADANGFVYLKGHRTVGGKISRIQEEIRSREYIENCCRQGRRSSGGRLPCLRQITIQYPFADVFG